jgi:uncharacterized damage-inducible protein DinB
VNGVSFAAMHESLPDRFRRLFAYEKESHASVLVSLRGVAESRRATPEFRKALGLLAHVALARWLWLKRLGEEVPADAVPTTDDEFFPAGVTLDELPGRFGAMEKAWFAYLARLDEAEVARVVSYRSLDGPAWTNTVDDVLTQLHGHSLYHRGQIASIVRGLGGDPAVTDFIYWARRPRGAA